MKAKEQDWDREKKIPKVLKGSDKSTKHRKSIYNMLRDYEEENDLDGDNEVAYGYHGNFNYTKQR